jgi:hypothetical protein
MTRFEKLTDGEYKLLARLGKELGRIHELTSEDVYWTFIGALGDGFIEAAPPPGVRDDLVRRDGKDIEQFKANKLHIKRWTEAGYISLLPSQSDSITQFLLTPHGIDYLSYQAKRGIVRWFIDAWSDLRTEIVSAIVSAIISVIVTIITAYLVLRLGLK